MSYALWVAGLACFLAFLGGFPLIRLLRHLKVGKQIRTEGPESHQVKTGTPTMGGILIWGSVFITTGLFNIVNNASISVPLLTTAITGAIGTLDDYLGLTQGGSGGLSARAKFGALTAVGLAASIAIYSVLGYDYVYVPTLAAPIHLGLLYIPLATLAIVGTANAVNLTDGLDSLAGVCAAVAFTCYGIIAHLQGQLPLTTFCLTVVGALLAFLWFNAHPASLFMGDAGSLSLGGALATVALMTGHLLLLPLIGFVFVAEAASVILQVGYFKLSGGRRLFLMSPLHHHFEHLGWSETQVAQRFWLVSMLTGMVGIALALV